MSPPEYIILLERIQQKLKEGNNIKDTIVQFAQEAKRDNRYHIYLQNLHNLHKFVTSENKKKKENKDQKIDFIQNETSHENETRYRFYSLAW